MVEKRWGEDKQFKDCMEEMEFILNFYIPITAAGLKKLAKKNVKCYHVTSSTWLKHIFDMEHNPDVILPTFTHWNVNRRPPFYGVATEGGYIFELTGDLLFASALDMQSERKNNTTWISLLKLERFQLMDIRPRSRMNASDFTEYLIDTQRTILDVAIEIVKPKLGEFKNKSNSEILEFIRTSIVDLWPGHIENPALVFSIVKPIVNQFKKEFNEYIKNEETLWSGFIDENLVDTEGINMEASNEFLITNYTIKKVYVGADELDDPESAVNTQDFGVPIGTEKEFNKVLGL